MALPTNNNEEICDKGQKNKTTLPLTQPPQKQLLFAQIISLLFIGGALYGVLAFLFPLEKVWLPPLTSLVLYAFIEHILTRAGKIQNFFERVNENQSCGREAAFVIGLPLVLAIVMGLWSEVPLRFLLVELWLVCAFETYLNRVIITLLDRVSTLRRRNIRREGIGQIMLWSISAVILFGGAQYWHRSVSAPLEDPGDKFSAVLVETYSNKGIWFAWPEKEKSDLYPLGFSRMERHISNDLGWGFISIVTWKYGISQEALSWELLVIGCGLLALFIGVATHNPLAFLTLGITLIIGYGTNNYLFQQRLGVLELIVGMGPLVSLPHFIRGRSYSTVLWWCLGCGVIVGVAGLIRQNTGQSLLATAVLLIVIFALFTYKRGPVLTSTAIIALISGFVLISMTLKGVLWYRDYRLNINGDSLNQISHGVWFPLLGGIGGGYPPDNIPPYPNALDLAFWDPTIFATINNESPLAFLVPGDSVQTQIVSSKIFLRYILQYPGEFVRNALYKAFELGALVIKDATSGWISGLLTLGILGVVEHGLRKFTRNDIPVITQANQQTALPCVFAGYILVGMTAIVPILTSPSYLGARHETTAALFATMMLTLYLTIQFLANGWKLSFKHVWTLVKVRKG
jgi:hypothetical protein